jgi:hypothetical protein
MPEPSDLTLALHPVAPCWVTVTIGGKERFARLLQAGERVEQRTAEEVSLLFGDAAACAFSINGKPGRVLGGPGEVVQVRINLANYKNFISP